MNKIVKIIFVVVVLLTTQGIVFTQPVTWMRYYYNYRADVAYSTQQTLDGGYIFTGLSYISGNSNILLIKTNYLGQVEWKKFLGDTSSNIFEWPKRIEQVTDGGYLIVGESNSKMFLLKIDVSGNIVWKKLYTNGNGRARGWSFRRTNDGGNILCGDIFYPSPISTYAYIVKTDSVGNMQWDNVYNDLLNVISFDIVPSDNSCYYFCAAQYIRKIDLQGNLIWSHSYQNGLGFVSFRSTGIQSDNVIYVAGISDSSGKSAFHLTKIDSSGDLYWQKRYLANDKGAGCNSMCLTANGQIAMTGDYWLQSGDIAFVKVSPLGNMLNFSIISPPGKVEEQARCIANTNDNGFIITGSTAIEGTEMFPNFLAIKTDSIGHTSKLIHINEYLSENKNFQLYQNYPNPFNSTTVINYDIKSSGFVKIIVADITGKQIVCLVNQFRNSGNYSINFDANNFQSGIYFYSLELSEKEIGNYKSTKKMLIIK